MLMLQEIELYISKRLVFGYQFLGKGLMAQSFLTLKSMLNVILIKF